jgi:hypothetical protein
VTRWAAQSGTARISVRAVRPSAAQGRNEALPRPRRQRTIAAHSRRASTPGASGAALDRSRSRPASPAHRTRNPRSTIQHQRHVRRATRGTAVDTRETWRRRRSRRGRGSFRRMHLALRLVAVLPSPRALLLACAPARTPTRGVSISGLLDLCHVSYLRLQRCRRSSVGSSLVSWVTTHRRYHQHFHFARCAIPDVATPLGGSTLDSKGVAMALRPVTDAGRTPRCVRGLQYG